MKGGLNEEEKKSETTGEKDKTHHRPETGQYWAPQGAQRH
jgi:hypothetical protein